MLLISAGIGATPVLAMLHALAEEHSDREIWCLHSARNSREHSFAAEARALLASLPNARSARVLQPSRSRTMSKAATSTPRAVSPGHVLAELEPPPDAQAYLCGPAPFHGRDQRRSGGARDRRLPHPHRTIRPRAGPDARASQQHPRGRRTHPPASPETAPRSSSPAATSRSRGTATTAACSNSPKRATCPSAGRAAPASATPARPPSSPATSNTTPIRSNPPPTEARSSAAHSHATTWCSICDWRQPWMARQPSCGGGRSASPAPTGV